MHSMHSSQRHHAVGHFHRGTRLEHRLSNVQDTLHGAFALLLLAVLSVGLTLLALWWVNQPQTDPHKDVLGWDRQGQRVDPEPVLVPH